jgi:hypothetical protein
MFARILDVFQPAQWHFRVDKVNIASNESAPLEITRHRNWASSQLLDCAIHLIRVALQDACKCIVGLLDLTNYDGFELAAGVLKVEIGLWMLA